MRAKGATQVSKPSLGDETYLWALQGTAEGLASKLHFDFSEKSILSIGALAHLVRAGVGSFRLDLSERGSSGVSRRLIS